MRAETAERVQRRRDIRRRQREKLLAKRKVVGAKYPRKKKCSRCGATYTEPESHFGHTTTSADGLQSFCNGCKGSLGERRRTLNVNARLKHHMATRIVSQLGSLAPEGISGNLEEYLGYRIPELVKHLDADLKERTNGALGIRQALIQGYHVDHIRPLSSFDVVQGDRIVWATFKSCWAISNLRAIPAAENLAKGSKQV